METVTSSLRGFVLTEDVSFLETYRASQSNIREDATTIRTLTADNPEQQARLLTLERLAAARFQQAEKVIGLRRTQGLKAVTDAF